MVSIENENNFRVALSGGINFVLGAGFSVLANSEAGEPLPLGAQLKAELIKEFDVPELEPLDLAGLCSILERRKQRELRAFFQKRFAVGRYDKRYAVLDILNIRAIFTTNIDNLLHKLFDSSQHHYLNDMSIYGPKTKDREAIDLVWLHGSIVHEDKPLTFSVFDLTTSFRSDPDRWYFLTERLQNCPTLFWGHGIADKDVIEAISPVTINQRPHKEKWLILRSPDEASVQYFHALGFSIIIADTSEMLDYLAQLNIQPTATSGVAHRTHELFPRYAIPSPRSVPVRPLRDFYEGSAPSWHDIFSDRLYKTSHYSKVINLLNAGEHTIVIGIPASGKTTLMMQVANDFLFDGHKLVCDALTPEEATHIVNKLHGARAVVFLDNYGDSVDAFNILIKASNILVAGFDRDSSYEGSAHRLKLKTRPYEITPLTEEDIQAIYSAMPLDIRSDGYVMPKTVERLSPYLFEVITANTRRDLPALRVRFQSELERLARQEPLDDLLVMMAYVHSCRTPISFDMIYAFLREYVSGWEDAMEMVYRLGGNVAERWIDAEQDYFSPRSDIIARAILDAASSKVFRRVLLRFHREVSPYRIPNYYTFKRAAFDEEHARRAFPERDDWEAGKDFYEESSQRDPSAYLLQQGALFLAHKKRFKEAFDWIDRALRQSRNQVFSIRNSHAVILFDANIAHAKAKPSDTEIRKTLDLSMSILEDCYRREDVARRAYHALRFGNQSIQYWEAYGDERAKEYLKTALKWLDDEQGPGRSPWRKESLQRLSRQIMRQASFT